MSEREKNGRKHEVGLTVGERFKAMENLQEVQRFSSLKPLNLNYFGAETCESGYAFGPFVRTSYVLHLVQAGQGTLSKHGEEIRVRAGQAFLIYPGEETTYRADDEDPWTYSWVGFHGIEADTMMRRAGFSEQEPVITCANIDQLQQIMSLLLESTELTYDNDLIRTGCLYFLIGRMIQNGSGDRSGETENWNSYYVNMAVNLLINSASTDMKVQDVADTIGLSRSYLSTIFKKEMHMSPQEFLTKFRMEKAADLLTSTDNPVGLIGAEVGYHDLLVFSKSFRRYHGMSPTQYRGRHIELVRARQKGAFTSENPL